jgi:hypothetical protein
MPSGHYVVLGPDGEPVGSEDFRCAPGPMGWRYFSDIKTIEPTPHDEIVDVAVDADWRPVRLRIETGAHRLLLQAGEGRLSGYRDGAAIETPWSDETHLDYFSPAFNAITCRRLSRTTEIEVVFIQPFTLEPVMQRQRYELLREEEVETKVGLFQATKWRYTSLGDGWTAHLWSAADIVVRYEALFELTAYEPGASGVSPTPAPSP